MRFLPVVALLVMACWVPAHAASKYRVLLVGPDDKCPAQTDEVLSFDTKETKFRMCIGDAPSSYTGTILFQNGCNCTLDNSVIQLK